MGRRVLIVGAGGMLGHKLCQQLAGGHDTVVGTLRRPASGYARFAGVFDGVSLIDGIDVLDERALDSVLEDVRPDVVLNAVGIVKQLREAGDRRLAVGINAWLPHRLARWCARREARLIHFSTDCVFDGSRGSYVEQDAADARDLYGLSKLLGETDTGERCALTLRSSIVGRELERPTHGLVEWFLAQRGGRVRGFARAIYSGLSTLELCRVVRRVIERHPELHGTLHVASAAISKYDLLLLARQAWGIDVEIERDETFVCDRSLVMGPFAAATGYGAPSWDAMVREMADDPTPYDRFHAGGAPAVRGGAPR